MTIFCSVSCYLLKKTESERKIAGDIFTDKRFFTDKPLIKTKNVTFGYNIVILVKRK